MAQRTRRAELVTPERFRSALCTTPVSERGEMPTPLPGRVTAWSGRRWDTGEVDQSSHMSRQLGAPGRQTHSCPTLPAHSHGVGLGMLPLAFLAPIES